MILNIPEMMRIEITNICNEKCSFCPYEKMNRKKGRMESKLFESLVQQHSKVENAKILFPATVGEPLLDNRFIEFVEYASNYYSNIATFSNGLLLNEQVARELLNAGLTDITLTLHGLTEKNYCAITGGDARQYNIVRNNIINFINVNCKRYKPAKVFLNIYTDLPRKEAEADEIIKIAIDGDVYVTINSMNKTHNWGGAVAKKTTFKREVGCARIYKQFGVLWDGTVVPCCIDYEGMVLEYK